MPTIPCMFLFVDETWAESERASLLFLRSIGIAGRNQVSLDGQEIFIEVERCPELIEKIFHLDELVETRFFGPKGVKTFCCIALTELGTTLYVVSQHFGDSMVFIPMKNIVSIGTDGPEYLKSGLQNVMTPRLPT